MRPKKKLLHLIFTLVMITGSFLFLEFLVGKPALKKFFPNDFKLNNHPLIELKSGRVQFRENLFENFKKPYFVGIEKSRHFKSIEGMITFNKNEGKVSTNFGDFVVNKWGVRGPYFELKKENIKRIVAVGGSTTLGWWVGNENTYPRILERMLNNSFNQDYNFQVINAGMYYHNSCDIKIKFLNKLLKFDPDIILLMSGWNDINLIRNPKIFSQKEYCPKSNVIESLNFYRLLKNIFLKIIGNNFKKRLGTEALNSNLKYFKKNIEFVAKISKHKGIQLGLVSLPTVLDKWSSITELSSNPQVIGTPDKEIEYQRKVGLKINHIYQEIAKKYDQSFYINSAISFDSRGKALFFSDFIHQTEAGNRLQAYAIYRKLNEMYKIHPNHGISFSDNLKIDQKQIELEYLKSIFAASKIEDLTYSGCVSFHRKCNINHTNFNNPVVDDFVFVTMALEFTLGSVLQYRKQLENYEIGRYYDAFLSKSIQLAPGFSLNYWAYSILKKIQGMKNQSQKLYFKAIELNPILANISFEKEYFKYQKRRIKNPFLNKISDLLFLLRSAPTYTSSYTFFHSLKGQQNLSMEKRQRLTSFLYYSTPLLAKSIFSDLIEHLVKKKDIYFASWLISNLHTLHPEYFYEKKLDRMYIKKGFSP